MMITSLLLDQEPKALYSLEKKILDHCPNVVVQATSNCIHNAQALISEKTPDLIILDLETSHVSDITWTMRDMSYQPEVIFLTKKSNSTLDIISKFAFQYLQKPIEKEGLITAVNKVDQCVQQKREKQKRLYKSRFSIPDNDLISVPTMEGFEFISASKIIRCEGLQKCTRIISQDRSDIVSSYHLGMFKKLLEPFGFFLAHRSFLINLSHIKKFHKEGTITMVDGAPVPLARRQRVEFMSLIRRI